MMKRGVGQWGDRMMGTDGGIHTREAKGIQSFSKHQGGTINQNIQGPCSYFDSERKNPLGGYPGPQPTSTCKAAWIIHPRFLKFLLVIVKNFGELRRRMTFPREIAGKDSGVRGCTCRGVRPSAGPPSDATTLADTVCLKI